MILTINVIFLTKVNILYLVHPLRGVCIHQPTTMSEDIAIMRNCTQILPARHPVVLLQKAEKLPEWREIMVPLLNGYDPFSRIVERCALSFLRQQIGNINVETFHIA